MLASTSTCTRTTPMLTRILWTTCPTRTSTFTLVARLLAEATLVLTDSGGVQEEAPGLGKPVLVLRNDTERPEAVVSGTVKLVGTGGDRIYAEAARLLNDPNAYAEMANAVNPYGDGRAAERSVAAISELLGLGERMPDFTSG